jgi:hypothetical protein
MAVVNAATAVQKNRPENAHVPGPLPKSADELVAECGHAHIRRMRDALAHVSELTKYFRGSPFPASIEGREKSPYSALLKGIVCNPKLVGSDMKPFPDVEHFGKPFTRKFPS